MEDLGTNDKSQNGGQFSVKSDTKIPFNFMDMHHQVIDLVLTPSIENHILPKTGNTIVSFNAHVDEIVPEDMQLRFLLKPPTKKDSLFHDFGIQSWINEFAKNGHVKHVIWIKPPWNTGVPDGHRDLEITNENDKHEVSLDIKTLGQSVFEEDKQENYEDFHTMFLKYLKPEDSYILDLELSFFSSDNSFTTDYEKCLDYYKYFQEVFHVKHPKSMSEADIKVAKEEQIEKFAELEKIFDHLQTHRTLPPVEGDISPWYTKVSALRDELLKYYEDSDIKWQYMYDAGLVCNDYQMPVHFTKREDIERMVNECVSKVIDLIPCTPSVVTVAVMYEYLRFTKEDDLDFIIDLLKDLFKKKFPNLDGADFIGY